MISFHARVQPTGGIRRDLQAFFWLRAFSCSQAESQPAHQRLTHTVRRTRNQVTFQFKEYRVSILDSVQKDYPSIDKAAGEFLHKLSGNNIKRDIMLAAEMAGLKLLRAANVDLSKVGEGTIVLGAIPDEIYEQIQRFIFGWALSNGIDPRDIGKVQLANDMTGYLPEITKLEKVFHNICKQNNIKEELYPFVAASSALKLVLAGEKLKLLDAKTGLTMTMYHIISGSKTAPYKSDGKY
jgi:hypothetical protein